MSIVHETPGLLDIRAVTTFGLHAKPNSLNPIGTFGTGLKYAIAVLLRSGCKIHLYIGETEYEFFTKPGKFRGVDYAQVMMRKRASLIKRWSTVELPFTLEHGKNWEVWQAFRELESNTRDENGTTGVYDNFEPQPGCTTFIVEGDSYADAYYDRDKIFLPGSLTRREGDETVQVFNEPSKHLYWRGIRVFDLEQPSIYTYNILDHLELTEDRTLKYLWGAQSKIAAYVARSRDRKLINAVVSADTEKHFEGRLDWDYAYQTPSEEFKEVVEKKRYRGTYIAPRALAFYDRYVPPANKEETTRDRLARWAYEPTLPADLRDLLTHLLRCRIEEATETTGDIPF